MSYILDALKKIEHEKNSRVQPNGRVNLAGDLFRERKPPAGKEGFRKIIIPVAAACLLTCAGTWFVLSDKNTAKTAGVRPPDPAVQTTLPAITPPVPVPVTAPMPATAPVPEPVQKVPVPAPPTSPTAAAPPGQTVSAENSDQSARSGRRSDTRRAVPAAPKQPVQTVAVPPDIKLSGIAWQDERSARRAVINGFLLREGTVVAGATISDIQADRVRFTSTAGAFEIKLDTALPGEVKR